MSLYAYLIVSILRNLRDCPGGCVHPKLGASFRLPLGRTTKIPQPIALDYPKSGMQPDGMPWHSRFEYLGCGLVVFGAG